MYKMNFQRIIKLYVKGQEVVRWIVQDSVSLEPSNFVSCFLKFTKPLLLACIKNPQQDKSCLLVHKTSSHHYTIYMYITTDHRKEQVTLLSILKQRRREIN